MSRYTDVDHRNRVLPHVGAYWSVELVSLEEALKPVEESINELDRSVNTAKKHCNFPSEHGLTLDESAALYLYTMESDKNSFYKVLNEALRSDNRPAIKPWFPFLKLFDIALSKLPTVKENIWRGVSGDISRQFKKDEILTWWSISSCTKSLDVIEEFLGSDANSTLFMIESVNGKDVSKYTAFPNENEVIMGVGTELRVKSNTLNHHGGLNVVHLVELSNDDDVEQLSDSPGTMNFKQQIPISGLDSGY
jgi:hypothetical protein